jgi:integrase
VLDAAEITGNGYTIHSWRHTAATRLAESGADMETRKRILGHRTDEMAAHYDHAAHLEQTRAALNAAAETIREA